MSSHGALLRIVHFITESELGSTTNHSNVGVIPTALQGSGDGGSALSPSLLIHDYQITCSVAGIAPETYQHLSIVVAVNCVNTGAAGSLPCDETSSPLGGEGNFTVQIDLICAGTEWERGTAGVGLSTRDNTLEIPAIGTLDTALDSKCGQCINNRLKESVLTPAAVYDAESHCVGTELVVYNMMQMS